jgi:hypothetical protein
MSRGRGLSLSILIALQIATITLGAAEGHKNRGNDEQKDAKTNPKIRGVRIDLAEMVAGQITTRPGGPGSYQFVLVNLVPKFRPYAVNISRDFVLIEPLTFPGGAPKPPAPSGDVLLGESTAPSCTDKLKQDLAAATSEAGVKEIVNKAISDSSAGCMDEVLAMIRAQTEQVIDDPDVFTIGPAETIRITIARAGGATWTYVLEGKPSGEWRTTYGFFFVPDRDERYFTKETHPTETTSKFTITKQPHRQNLDFVPTVLFTFLPYSQIGKKWSNGWAAGLGYDLQKPVLVAGYAGTYNENVVFTAGVAIHQQSRLIGRYKPSEEVKEALDSSQLVENTFAPNIYVGIGFRFGEDIHARRRELEKETAKAQAESAAAKAAAAQAEKDAAARKAACEAKADADEAGAKQKCAAGDDACVKKAAADSAAAKTQCAVTDADRRDAAATANAAKAAADAAAAAATKAEKRAQCEKAAKADHDAAISACGANDDPCKKKAEATFENKKLGCLNN